MVFNTRRAVLATTTHSYIYVQMFAPTKVPYDKLLQMLMQEGSLKEDPCQIHK